MEKVAFSKRKTPRGDGSVSTAPRFVNQTEQKSFKAFYSGLVRKERFHFKSVPFKIHFVSRTLMSS